VRLRYHYDACNSDTTCNFIIVKWSRNGSLQQQQLQLCVYRHLDLSSRDSDPFFFPGLGPICLVEQTCAFFFKLIHTTRYGKPNFVVRCLFCFYFHRRFKFDPEFRWQAFIVSNSSYLFHIMQSSEGGQSLREKYKRLGKIFLRSTLSFNVRRCGQPGGPWATSGPKPLVTWLVELFVNLLLVQGFSTGVPRNPRVPQEIVIEKNKHLFWTCCPK
jgi:hypothetical protein